MAPGKNTIFGRMSSGATKAARQWGLFQSFKTQVRPVDPRELEYWIRTRGMQRQSLADIYNQMMLLSYDRDALYRDYEAITEDSTVASALELFADDAVPYDVKRGMSLWVESEDKNLEDQLNRRLAEINIENNVWDWAFTTGMYGDHGVRIHAEPGAGIKSIDDTRHPADFERVDINGRLVAFRDMTMPEGVQFVNPFEYVHFRILSAYRRRRFAETGMTRNPYMRLAQAKEEQYTLTSKYGVSLMANARRPWVQLTSVENAMIMNRMARSPRTVYFLALDDATPKTASVWADMIEERLMANTSIDQFNSELGTYPDDLAMGRDVVLPYPQSAQMNAQEFGQRIEVRGIQDVEYLRDKFYGALKTPKPFLGLEDSLPGGIGENSLLYISIRYARSVRRLQRSTCDGVKRLLTIDHLLRHPGKVLSPDAFRVVTGPSSTAEEIQRRNVSETAVNTVDRIVQVCESLGIKHRIDADELGRQIIEEGFPGVDFDRIWLDNDDEAAEKFRNKIANQLMAPPEAQGQGGGDSANGSTGNPFTNGNGSQQREWGKRPRDPGLRKISDAKLRRMVESPPRNPEDQAALANEVLSRYMHRERVAEARPGYMPEDPDLEVMKHELNRCNRLRRKAQVRGVSLSSSAYRLDDGTQQKAAMVIERAEKAKARSESRAAGVRKFRMIQGVMRDYGMTEEDATFVVETANDYSEGGRLDMDSMPPDIRNRVEELYRKYPPKKEAATHDAT